MSIATGREALILALVIVYSFAVMGWAALVSPLAPEEAKTIFMGRTVAAEMGLMRGASPGASTCGYMGSTVVGPPVLALLDRAAGMYGARLFGIVPGLLLIVLLYMVGNTPQYGGRGLLTASVFVLLGLPLEVMPAATGDAAAAFCLGGALLCVELGAASAPGRRRDLLAFGSAALLASAVMTNYIAVLYAVPFIFYVILQHRPFAAGVFFLAPLLLILGLYGWLAVMPDWYALMDGLALFRPVSAKAGGSPSAYVFNLLNMTYLLAVVGIFHKNGGKNSVMLLLISAPGLLIHALSSDVSRMHTAALYSMVFLAPAAAVGVSQMVELFTYSNDMKIAKPLFTVAVLVVIWTFGVQQIKMLGSERPDLRPAAEFFKGRGSAQLLVDSDYGSPEYVYSYYIGRKNPLVKVSYLTRCSTQDRNGVVASMRPDFVVVDSYYSVRSYDEARRDYTAQGYKVAAMYRMPVAAELNNIVIFQKGTL